MGYVVMPGPPSANPGGHSSRGKSMSYENGMLSFWNGRHSSSVSRDADTLLNNWLNALITTDVTANGSGARSRRGKAVIIIVPVGRQRGGGLRRFKWRFWTVCSAYPTRGVAPVKVGVWAALLSRNGEGVQIIWL